MELAHATDFSLKRRERVMSELRRVFEGARLDVTQSGAYRHEKLDDWGWLALSERLMELIDRGKLS